MTPSVASPAQAEFDWLDSFSWFGLEDPTPGAADAWSFNDWGGLLLGDQGAWMAFDDQVYQAIYDPMQAMLDNSANDWWLNPLNEMFATGEIGRASCRERV